MRAQMDILQPQIPALHSRTAPARRSRIFYPPKLSTQLPAREKFAAASVLSLAYFTENTILIDLSIPHRHVYPCIIFVASPHVSITAPRSSLIASGISWAFIRCSAIRPVRILAGVLFLLLSSLSLFHYNLHLASFASARPSGLLFSYLLLTISSSSSPGAQTQNVYALISLVYIAIHLSITLHMNKYPTTHSQFHKLFILSFLPSIYSKYLTNLIKDQMLELYIYILLYVQLN